MFNIAKWLIGIAFALLQLDKNVISIAGSGCIIVGELYADCVDKLPEGSSSLPSDLKKDIEVLNISQNQLEKLTDNEFVEFTKLKELIMASMSVSSVSVKLFEPLTELQVLNLSGSNLGEPPAKFPPSVKRLIVENTIFKPIRFYIRETDVEEMDFSELHQLEELYLRDNGLDKLPNVATIAPLIHLELGENELMKLTYKDIAPFCRLKQVGLGNDTALSSNELVIQCCGLQSWLKKYNITTDLECAVNCPVQELSNDAVTAYEICIENMKSDQALYGTIINIILSAALIGAIGYLALKYYRSHAVRYEHDVVKVENLESVEEEAQPEQQNYEE